MGIGRRLSTLLASRWLSSPFLKTPDELVTQEIIAQLDAKVFIRVPRDVLKHRREKREYHVAGKLPPVHRETYFDGRPEGVWQDPPGYFEKIVWPAYEKAH